MNERRPPYVSHRHTTIVGEAPEDFRSRVLQQQSETLERRRLDLLEQASDLKTASDRIRIWERLHDTRLPKEPGHLLIAVIAARTQLTVDEVLEEQKRRFP